MGGGNRINKYVEETHLCSGRIEKKSPSFGLGRCMMGNLTVVKKRERETWGRVLKSLTIYAGRVDENVV